MPTWAVAIGVFYAIASMGSLFLIWAAGRISAQREDSMPVDDMVDIVAEEKEQVAYMLQRRRILRSVQEPNLDDLERQAHDAYDAYRYRYRLPGERDIAAQDAAETHQENQR